MIGVEPNIEAIPEKLKHIELVEFDIAAKEADVQVLLVDYKEFKEASQAKGLVIDTKGIW